MKADFIGLRRAALRRLFFSFDCFMVGNFPTIYQFPLYGTYSLVVYAEARRSLAGRVIRRLSNGIRNQFPLLRLVKMTAGDV